MKKKKRCSHCLFVCLHCPPMRPHKQCAGPIKPFVLHIRWRQISRQLLYYFTKSAAAWSTKIKTCFHGCTFSASRFDLPSTRRLQQRWIRSEQEAVKRCKTVQKNNSTHTQLKKKKTVAMAAARAHTHTFRLDLSGPFAATAISSSVNSFRLPSCMRTV